MFLSSCGTGHRTSIAGITILVFLPISLVRLSGQETLTAIVAEFVARDSSLAAAREDRKAAAAMSGTWTPGLKGSQATAAFLADPFVEGSSVGIDLSASLPLAGAKERLKAKEQELSADLRLEFAFLDRVAQFLSICADLVEAREKAALSEADLATYAALLEDTQNMATAVAGTVTAVLVAEGDTISVRCRPSGSTPSDPSSGR